MSTIHDLPRPCGRVLVVGAGVSGLTSALCLARAGVDVEVVAEKFQSELHEHRPQLRPWRLGLQLLLGCAHEVMATITGEMASRDALAA